MEYSIGKQDGWIGMSERYPLSDEDVKLVDELGIIFRMSDIVLDECNDFLRATSTRDRRICIFAIAKLLLDLKVSKSG